MSASETTAFVAAVTDAAEEGDARVRELARDFEGTGSISPSLYWWRQGSVTQLPARYDGRDVHFMPPDDFFAALNALPAAG